MTHTKQRYRPARAAVFACLILGYAALAQGQPGDTDGVDADQAHSAVTNTTVVEISLTVPEADTALALSIAAVKAAQAQQPGIARLRINEAFELDAGDPQVQANAAVVQMYEGDYRGALRILDTLLAATPDSAFSADSSSVRSGTLPGVLQTGPLYLNRSLALRALGRYAESSNDYQRFLQANAR